MLKRLKRHDAKDSDLTQVQENLLQFLAQLTDNLVLDSRRILSTTVSGAGAVTISHTLGREPLGWYVTNIDAARTVHFTSWNSDVLVLTISGACTFDLVVF